MTTFTSEDREEAEKRQRFMNELQELQEPADWSANTAPWPFTEDDIVDGE